MGGRIKRGKENFFRTGGRGHDIYNDTKILGRRVEATQEATAYEPNKKFDYKSTSGPIPSQASITFESVGVGTKVTVALQGDVGGFFKLAEPIVHRIIKRQWNCKTTLYWRAGSHNNNFYLIMHEHLFVFRKPISVKKYRE